MVKAFESLGVRRERRRALPLMVTRTRLQAKCWQDNQYLRETPTGGVELEGESAPSPQL